MVDNRTTIGSIGAAARLRGLVLPVLAAAMVFVLLVPLPPASCTTPPSNSSLGAISTIAN